VKVDDPRRWEADASVHMDDPIDGFRVTVGPTTEVPDGGDPIRSRGTTARIVTTHIGNGLYRVALVLTLPDGQLLTVAAYCDEQQVVAVRDTVIRVAEKLDIAAKPDIAWAGR
jgi:hypothetical protein